MPYDEDSSTPGSLRAISQTRLYSAAGRRVRLQDDFAQLGPRRLFLCGRSLQPGARAFSSARFGAASCVSPCRNLPHAIARVCTPTNSEVNPRAAVFQQQNDHVPQVRAQLIERLRLRVGAGKPGTNAEIQARLGTAVNHQPVKVRSGRTRFAGTQPSLLLPCRVVTDGPRTVTPSGEVRRGYGQGTGRRCAQSAEAARRTPRA